MFNEWQFQANHSIMRSICTKIIMIFYIFRKFKHYYQLYAFPIVFRNFEIFKNIYVNHYEILESL